MKEGLIKDAYELIIKEIQTIITVSYIIAVAVGMLFNFKNMLNSTLIFLIMEMYLIF